MGKKKKKIATARSKMNGAKLGGPWLQTAVFCEKVLHEKDDVTTLIRIVDRLTISTPSEELPPGKIVIIAFLLFKAGDSEEKHQLDLVTRGPDGKQITKTSTTIEFANAGQPEGGAAVEAEIAITVDRIGLYLIDVRLDGRRVTRMPLRIAHKKIKRQQKSKGQ